VVRGERNNEETATAKKKRTAEYRTIEQQKAEVQSWNSDSALRHSAVRLFDILRFVFSFRFFRRTR
jgi:hypothetical protein